MESLTKTKDKHTPQSKKSSSRRSFLKMTWIILGIAAIGELIAVIISFMGRNRTDRNLQKTSTIIEAGKVDNFAPNSVTANIQGRFYLCRMDDGGFLALSSKCTHLGCTVPWDAKENRFACPCHGSSYDITGNVLTAPAPRPLDIYPVSIENKVVKVDTAKSIKRDKFYKEQLVYAEKEQI